MRLFLNFITAILLMFGVAVPAYSLDKGASAPQFSLPSRGTGPVNLERYKGKLVYLDFWASWCGPCKKSLPWMGDLKQQFTNEGLEIVAINLDTNREDAERMLSGKASELTVAFDPAGSTPEQYGVRTMPTSYLIGPDGKVLEVFEGFEDGETEKITALIKAQLNK